MYIALFFAISCLSKTSPCDRNDISRRIIPLKTRKMTTLANYSNPSSPIVRANISRYNTRNILCYITEENNEIKSAFTKYGTKHTYTWMFD